jgi:hypothetical protein
MRTSLIKLTTEGTRVLSTTVVEIENEPTDGQDNTIYIDLETFAKITDMANFYRVTGKLTTVELGEPSE